MEISKRLQAVAAYVPADAVLADIGTDHAFLPIWLIRQQRIREAYACDVKTGPLERARQHVTEAGLEDAVHLCLSDGLEALSGAHMTTVVIAGMGGYLTAQILLRDKRAGAPVLREVNGFNPAAAVGMGSGPTDRSCLWILYCRRANGGRTRKVLSDFT